MTAGNGASEQARLANERVLRLRRQLEQAERDERAWTAGATGERLVAEKLNDLTAQGWRVLHDVRWPGRPKANLDHILIGPGGVIVIDAKNWTGNVEVRGGVLRQNGCTRARETDSALQQGAAVAVLLEPRHRQLVQTWLCLVQQPELEGAALNGVRIYGLNLLSAAVNSLPNVLDADNVAAVHSYLGGLLVGNQSPDLLTTGDVDRSSASSVRPAHHQPPRKTFQAPPTRPWSTSPPTPAWRPPAPRSKQRSKPSSCFKIYVRVVLIVVGLAILQNILQSMGKPAPAPPTQPVPGVVKPTPAPPTQPVPGVVKTLPPK
ncbi:MAG: NERD domain-containing protein [Arthrobacter oryzae]